MKNKKRKIRFGRLLLVLSVMLILFLGPVYLLNKLFNNVEFIYGGEVLDKASIVLNYKGEELDLSPEKINLKAYKNGQEIKIAYEDIKIDHLGNYKVVYKANNDKFVLNLTLISDVKTILEGTKNYRVIKGNSFTKKDLDNKVYDLFHNELKYEINEIDTNTVGNKKLILSGEDFSYTLNVEVEEAIVTGIKIPNFKIVDKVEVDTLMNKEYALSHDFTVDDLVHVGNGQYLKKEAADACFKMIDAANDDGIYINVVSGFRTYDKQYDLFTMYYANDPENAFTYSAYPRTSEHETGLAMDISYDFCLYEDLLETDLGKWMSANAHKFGFILRYPEGKENITGYMFEAWHYRYVGEELANELKTTGLTLEEYYQK